MRFFRVFWAESLGHRQEGLPSSDQTYRSAFSQLFPAISFPSILESGKVADKFPVFLVLSGSLSSSFEFPSVLP